MLSVLLVGAAGPTGRAIIEASRGSAILLRALARDPAKLNDVPVEVVQGDVRDPQSLGHAMRGIDVVVSALGTPLILQGPVTLLSDGTRNILCAMQESGTPRLLCITGMGAGDSKGHGGFLYDRVLLPLLLGRVYADKERQETAVSQSDRDWILIRPAMLTNGPARGVWRTITARDWPDQRPMTRIARADVAKFVVEELLTPRHHNQAVNLSY